MKAEFVNPFIGAAVSVLEQETGAEVKTGDLRLEESPLDSDEVTVLIGVVGQAQGVVMYGMSEKTAKGIISAMVGEPVALFDAMAESAIAELGNVITGRASVALETSGVTCKIAPPSVVVGRGTSISTLAIQRLVIPLSTEHGEVEVHVALRASA